jgi:arylsulfatase A
MDGSVSRREFIGILGASVASLGMSRFVQGGEAPMKANLVHILCDDLGYGDLASYGNPVIKTPCLDEMASKGMRLTDCYAAAPVCSPARSGVMTGRNPYRSGIRDWIPANSHICLKEQEITVSRLLKSGGYATCHSGKWHLSSTLDGSEPTPGDHGFDHWFSTQNNAAPNHHNPRNFFRNGNPVGPLDGWSSELIVDEAIRFIKRVGDKAFAVFVWFHSPHEPVATPEEYVKMYPEVDDPTKAVYFGNVTQLDHEVGRLMKALDEMKLASNTFVMFTSDNGPETLRRYGGARYSHGSPGRLRGMKLHMYEGGIRVPGIIYWPGHTRPGQVCREPVNGTDILPTFCEIAGVNVLGDRVIDGASIVPIFAGRYIERTIPLYWRYDKALGEPKHALRVGNWKLLADAAFEKFELYNLETDLAETADLSANEPERLKKMVATMRQLHSQIESDPLSK